MRFVYGSIAVAAYLLMIPAIPLTWVGIDGPFFWLWEQWLYFGSWGRSDPPWPGQVSPAGELKRWVGETFFGTPARFGLTLMGWFALCYFGTLFLFVRPR